jgi:hypothetical protein
VRHARNLAIRPREVTQIAASCRAVAPTACGIPREQVSPATSASLALAAVPAMGTHLEPYWLALSPVYASVYDS